MQLSPQTLLQGGKYKIIEEIGQGGFGIAYRAIHQGLQSEVCIKEFFYSDLCERAKDSSRITIISTSAEKIRLVDSLQKKFSKEAQRLAKFQHPNIVQVTDTFEENNTAYFVMEFLDGGSLDDLIRRDGAMSEQKAKALILPIIDAMDAVHKKDLLHLDIKPANIMLRKNQSAVLIDFGISKYLETANGNTTTAPIGISKGYAPLEQYGGSISDFSKATDVYSLCATIYNMVTGLTPPEPLQMLTNGFKSPRDLRPQLTPDFNATILKGLSTKAVDRQQTMAQLKAAFGEVKMNNQTIVETKTATIVEKSELVLDTADAYYQRAEAKRNKGKFKEAIKDYSEAIKKNSKNENYYFFRGLCYQELGNNNAAIKNYSKATELNPNKDSGYYNRSICYNQIGDYESACTDCYRAYEIEQKVKYFNHWLKMADKSQDLETINKYLLNEKWLNKDKVYFLRGHVFLKKNISHKACVDFYQAYQLSKDEKQLELWICSNKKDMLSDYLERDLPYKSRVLFNRGKVQVDYQNKADDFYQAYKLSKNDEYIQYWRNLGDIEILNLYLEKDLPNKEEVLFKRGKLQKKSKSRADDFFKAYQISKNEKFIKDWQNTKDIEMLSYYIEKDLPSKDEVLFKKGILQIELGEKINGIEDLKKAKRLGNNDAIEWLNKNTLLGRITHPSFSTLFVITFIIVAINWIINYI